MTGQTIRRAAITGLGAVSGFGAGAELLWAALLAGRRAMRLQQCLQAVGLDIGPVALYEALPLDWTDGSRQLGRASQMAITAGKEALEDAGISSDGARLAVTCGTTLGEIDSFLSVVRGDVPRTAWGYPAPAHALAAAVGAEGPVEISSVACASGNAALGAALELVRTGRAEVVLAGGVDALNDFVVSGFASLKALDPAPCRPFDQSRAGLNLGEGAAFLVIEAEPHARARGATIRAFLDGCGVAADAVHMTGPDREGRGAARAMRAALHDANATAGDVDAVSAHGTATPFNDLMESKALELVLGSRAATTPLNSIKSALGHTLGAAGALEALMAVRALQIGRLPPTPGFAQLDAEIRLDVVHTSPREINARVILSTSSGFGGTNAAVVLRSAT